MIKLRAGEVVVFGLSTENIKRLQEGMPIKFDGEQIGIEGITFYIAWGETESALLCELTGEKMQ